jgi:hypothetical protein
MRLLLVGLVAAGVLSPVRFAQRPGWHVGAGTAHACPGVPAVRCSQVWSWAATVHWRGCTGCLPHRLLATLPPDGIAIQVALATERPQVAKRTLTWPPQLRAGDVVAGFEGVSGRIGVYQHFARVGRYEVYLWVFFGRSRPSGRQLAAANAELRTARLPRR